ncbi:MAG: glutamate--tRNA ligase [Chloroflexia bacterium]|nr:glutamate--tRNA ligase [Chloroflexia bacterium]
MTTTATTTDRPRAILAELAEVRVRFSPSPTGSLHIGGAKSAMYNVLFAHGQAPREGKRGTFILRIEDTDQKRLVEGAAEELMAALRWLGLEWDEGPDVGGPCAPYIQSQRTALYREHAERLVETGHAYHCFCTPERLAQVREEQQARKQPPGYDRHCRDLPAAEVGARLATGATSVVRFKMPVTGETRFVDLLRGEIVYQNDKIEDLVLLKTDGFPTYHLANVVDDHLMRITHIFRAAEWIPTAPLHVQMYAAFGWEPPQFAHLPLILAPTGGKLSKRHGSTAVEEFRAQGYLPEALRNYLALLGWSLDDHTEVFSLDDLLAHFTIERVSPSPSTFDRPKLDWMNQYYINHILTVDDLTGRVIPFLNRAGLIADGAADASHPAFAQVRAATALLKDRLTRLDEAPELMSYFLRDEVEPYDAALLVPKKTEPAVALSALEAVTRVLPNLDISDEAAVETRLRALAGELGVKAGQLFMPIRVAITGRTQSPGLFETMRVIGQARCEARLGQAVALLREHVAVA